MIAAVLFNCWSQMQLIEQIVAVLFRRMEEDGGNLLHLPNQ